LANKSLYVGNMPYSAGEDDIRELFEPFGPIGEIRVIGDKGFGFVDIPEENVAAAIEAINGKELGGRTLTVNEARPRTERSGGGRSGGGRGGFGGGGGRRW
jgi:RNA recognition motif-containing protein